MSEVINISPENYPPHPPRPVSRITFWRLLDALEVVQDPEHRRRLRSRVLSHSEGIPREFWSEV